MDDRENPGETSVPEPMSADGQSRNGVSVMDDDTFARYVEGHYSGRVRMYDKMAKRSRLVYATLQWGLIILSALTPVLIVAGGEPERWAAAVVAVGVAIGTSALKTFHFEENWVNYRTICEMLRREIHLLEARVPPYREAADGRALFAERVEDIILQEHKMWRATVSAPKSEEDQPKRG